MKSLEEQFLILATVTDVLKSSRVEVLSSTAGLLVIDSMLHSVTHNSVNQD